MAGDAEARFPTVDWQRHEDELHLPSRVRRVVALLVDIMVVAVFAVVPDGLWTLTIDALTDATDLVNIVAFGVFFAAVLAVYATILTFLTGGQTLGKALLALSVRRVPDTSIQINLKDLGWTAARFGLGYVFVDLFGAGMLAGLATPRRRCLHDMVFGSQVVLLLEEANRPGPEPGVARLRDWNERLAEGIREVAERYGFLGQIVVVIAKVVGLLAAAIAAAAGGATLAGRILSAGLERLNSLSTNTLTVPATPGPGTAAKVGVGTVATGLTIGATVVALAPGPSIEGEWLSAGIRIDRIGADRFVGTTLLEVPEGTSNCLIPLGQEILRIRGDGPRYAGEARWQRRQAGQACEDLRVF